MRILLTGSKGQLAQCFRDRLPDKWEVISTDSASLDITDATAVFNMVQNFQPDAIVNAAAYTAVDKAEREYRKAFAINASAVHNLAAAAYEAKVRFIHISTDYVFEGDGKNPYCEHDVPNPQSIYGKSKLSGEFLALAANPESIVVRTAWLFSEYGENFVKTMLRLAKERDTLSVVNDQIGNPTYAGDLAQALIDILKSAGPARGVYHFCGDKSVSWYEFAQAIFQTASESRLQKSAATQEMRRLFRHRPAEYHPAVADRQHDVSAHARAAGLPDQNRTVLAAVQSEHPAQTLRLAARDTAQFDARRQGRRGAVECVTVGTAQKRRTQAHASDPFRRHTAAMRRTQRYDAPAHFIGMGGGKMAQHQPAQAVADEMQRPAAVPACLDKAVQGGGMLRQRLPHAVITEGIDGETLFFQ